MGKVPIRRLAAKMAAVMGFILMVSCGGASEDDRTIAYVSVNRDSSYAKTFQELHLGTLFDFKLRRNEADRTWVSIWVEGYRDGKPTNPPRLAEFSYGNSPRPKVEGPMGFGIVSQADGAPSFILYAEGAMTGLQRIDALTDWNEPLPTAWGYAFSDEEELGVAAGDTKVLAVYRKVAGNSIRTIDDSNPEALAAMIRENKMVLLLKMNVEYDAPSAAETPTD